MKVLQRTEIMLQLLQEPIKDAVKEKQIDSEFYMEQTAMEFKLLNGFSEIKMEFNNKE